VNRVTYRHLQVGLNLTVLVYIKTSIAVDKDGRVRVGGLVVSAEMCLFKTNNAHGQKDMKALG